MTRKKYRQRERDTDREWERDENRECECAVEAIIPGGLNPLTKGQTGGRCSNVMLASHFIPQDGQPGRWNDLLYKINAKALLGCICHSNLLVNWKRTQKRSLDQMAGSLFQCAVYFTTQPGSSYANKCCTNRTQNSCSWGSEKCWPKCVTMQHLLEGMQ